MAKRHKFMKKFGKNTNSYSLARNLKRTLALYWEIDRISLLAYIVLIILQVTSSILTIYFASRIIGQLTRVFENKPVSTGHVYLLLLASTLAVLVERFSWRWITFVERRSWIKWYVRMTVDFNSATSALDMEQHDDFNLKKRIQKVSQEYQYTPQNFANYIRTRNSYCQAYNGIAEVVVLSDQ